MSNFILKTLETRELKLNTIRLRGFYGGKLRKGSGGGGSGDGFPQLPGDVTRWHFGGLTNEMMAAMDDPRIEDADHKGRFLSFKNFAWSGMSGVNGYKFDFLLNEWATSNDQISEKYSYKIVINNKQNSVQLINNSGHIKITLKITGIEINKSIFRVYDNAGMEHKQDYTKDGIYEIDYTANEGANKIYFYVVGGNIGQLENPITIEQLPLYPGALVFDGVDDWAGCDNLPLLPKEKGYSIIALRNWITRYDATQYKRPLISNLDTNDEGAFLIEYREDENVNDVTGSYNSFTDVYIDDNNPITWQTSSSYNGQIIKKGTSKSTNKLCICKTYFGQLSNYANAAIWEIVILDHDATEEELTKIKDYFVKTYPWLFPDQAWTVTGKTNEDEDRATIANITGNGNNLVLSNFGFAEGSGYGLYYQYFGNEFKATNGEIEGGGWNIIDNYNISHDKRIPINSIGKCFWGNKALVNGIKLRFKLTGMTEGDVLAFGYAATYDLTYTSDGIYAIDLPPVDKPYGFSLQSSLTENLPTTPVTIELLPFEYEGYLVTDGVDDKAVSKQFKFGENFTVILDFKFPVKKISYCGFDLSSKVRIQNLQGSGVYVVLKGNRTLIPSNVVRAVTSEGKVYDENWNEYNIVPGNISSNYTMVNLGFDGSNQFAESATKLAGIYSSALSKDDCIKAYNYLQTLKAK
jgi:hypothetical protein